MISIIKHITNLILNWLYNIKLKKVCLTTYLVVKDGVESLGEFKSVPDAARFMGRYDPNGLLRLSVVEKNTGIVQDEEFLEHLIDLGFSCGEIEHPDRKIPRTFNWMKEGF